LADELQGSIDGMYFKYRNGMVWLRDIDFHGNSIIPSTIIAPILALKHNDNRGRRRCRLDISYTETTCHPRKLEFTLDPSDIVPYDVVREI
jgi:hypothetical protein